MKKPHLLSLIFLIFIVTSISGQTVHTLYASKDALIRRFDLGGDTLNYGGYKYINMHVWTNSSLYVVHRSLIDFDLTSIQSDSISSATLKLYSDIYSTDYPSGHIYWTSFPKNDLMIQRITEDWEEYEVNWNNRPGVTFKNEVYVLPSYNDFQNYEIDVTDIVKDMLAEPENSHGFLIKLLTEWPYIRTVFASSDNATSEFHPRLEIVYLTTEISEKSVVDQFNIYPNPASEKVTVVSMQYRKSESYKLTIVNSLGKEIKSIENTSEIRLTVDISGFNKGIYYFNFYRNKVLIASEELIVH